MPQVVRRTDLNDDGAEIVRTLQKTVFANFLEVSVDGSIVADHAVPPPPEDGEEPSEEQLPPGHSDIKTQNGSSSVFAEGIPINRITDEDSCAEHIRITGSPNVFVGGDKKAASKESTKETDTKKSGSNLKITKEVEGEGGTKQITFENGNQITVDKYGNMINSTVDRDGQKLYYIEPQKEYKITVQDGLSVSAWAGDGKIIYTDSTGNVLPTVTVSEFSYVAVPGGVNWAPPVVINQTVPTGDPIPGNENKW